MDMNNPTLKIVVEDPTEAHFLATLEQGSVLKSVDVSSVLDDHGNDPKKLTRRNIRISNEKVVGNLLIMKVLPTKVKGVYDFIIFPNMFQDNMFDFDDYDNKLSDALIKRKSYKLENL